MVICMHCHYAKQPCTVDGVTALNPVDQYCPQGSHKSICFPFWCFWLFVTEEVNAFASALMSLNQSNEAIISLTQQYLVGLNIMAHNENIQVQLARLQECLPSTQGSYNDKGLDNGEDSDDDKIEEGQAGPSQRKSKSG